ncbi:MAG: hypothetical protein ABW003_09455 [Microvirga sp.]
MMDLFKMLLLLLFLGIAPANAVPREPSCLKATNAENTSRLVAQCKAISEPNRPSSACSSQKSCTVIIREIIRLCNNHPSGRSYVKDFCKDYPADMGLPED